MRFTHVKGPLLRAIKFAIPFLLSTSLAVGQEIPAWEGLKAGTSTFFGGLRRLNPGYWVDEYYGWHGVEAQTQLRYAMVERHAALQGSYGINPTGSFLLDTLGGPFYSALTGRDIAFETDLSASEYLMSTSSVLFMIAGNLATARSVTGFNPGIARNHAGQFYYSNRIHITPRQAAQVSTSRPGRRFRPEFEELESRTELSANHSEILTPWRTERKFSSADYISAEDLQGAKLGKYIGQGRFNFVFHVENLKVADTPLIFRSAKAPPNPELFNIPSSGYLAGMYALADRQYSFFHPMARKFHFSEIAAFERTQPIVDPRAAGLLYGYFDFYRGENHWQNYRRRGVTPSADQWELLVDQLYLSGRRGFKMEDLHLKNIVEGYIVDFMYDTDSPINALEFNMNQYREILNLMKLDKAPVPFPDFE